MSGVIRELWFIVAVISAIVVVAWWFGPGDLNLTTEKHCLEVVKRIEAQLKAQTDQRLTPSERVRLASCSGP
ncbi:MAG TPA: hypothetical protein VGJ20_40320 [Xanthobacteraceae bacterium]|jgi:hypothetical protein